MVTHDESRDAQPGDRDDGPDRFPLTTRGFLGGSAATAGGLAGCTAVQEEGTPDASAPQGGPPERDAPDQRQAATQWTGNVDAGGNALTNLGQLNRSIVVAEDESLNEALDRASGDVEVILPRGETRFTDTITDHEGTLVIRGRGKRSSTLVADHTRLLWDHSEHADTTLVLEGFTFDGANLASDGGYILRRGTGGCRLVFRDLGVRNVDLTDHTNNAVGFVSYRGHLDEVVFDGVTYRADTFSNVQDNKYAVVRGTSGDTIDRLLVTDTCHFVGRLWDGSDDPQACIGFHVGVTESALVDGQFDEWDQWATAIALADARATVEIRASTREMGNGDQFWLSSNVSGGGGVVRYFGSGHGAPHGGDRVFVLGGGGHEGVDVLRLDCESDDAHVPVEVNGARTVTGTVTCRNSGYLVTDLDEWDGPAPGAVDADDPDRIGRMAIYFRDRDAGYRHVNLRVNVLNESDTDRYMNPAIGLFETNGRWDDDGFYVFEGQVSGAVTEALRDETDDGTTVIDDRLYSS